MILLIINVVFIAAQPCLFLFDFLPEEEAMPQTAGTFSAKVAAFDKSVFVLHEAALQ